MSPNGRYVLYSKYVRDKNNHYEVGIYDMQTDIFRTKDLTNDSLKYKYQEFYFGLIGNLPIVWYYYDSGNSLYYTHSSYDFDTETISKRQGYINHFWTVPNNSNHHYSTSQKQELSINKYLSLL